MVIEKRWWQKLLLFLTLVCMVGVIYGLSLVGTKSDIAGVYLTDASVSQPTGENAQEVSESELTDEAVLAMAPAVTNNEAFDRYRVVRLQGHSRQMETMQDILAQQTLAPDEKALVADHLYRFIERSENERAIEGLLIATGMQDALVFLGDQAAEVILPHAISLEDAERIGALLTRVANVSLDRITIIDGGL